MKTPFDNLSTEELFAAGNYAGVAMRGDLDRWQTYASYGLCGLTEKALDGLAKYGGPQVDFFKAVTHWIGGNERDAVQLLKKVNDEHARRLVAFIERPQIDVLAQLSWQRRGPQDLLTGIREDLKFEVENISFHEEDLQNAPYADIHNYYIPQDPPAFFVSEMVEWHVTPPNLAELPCPIFGSTSDYDLHVQAQVPWLQLFDEMVASDQIEWHEVGALVRPGAISSFPKVFGVPYGLPPVPKGNRKLDFFLSGSLRHPYWPERTEVIYELLQDKKLEPRLIQGFLPDEIYNRLLGVTKTSFSFLRHPSALPTRAIESLAMGSAVLVQEGSILTLYAGEDHGVVTYKTGEELPGAIRRVLDEWSRYEEAAYKGAHLVREQFSLPKVASQYMRYLTFLAAKPRPERKRRVGAPFQKRIVATKGWLPPEEKDRAAIRKETIGRMGVAVARSQSPHAANDLAREVVLMAVAADEDGRFAEKNPALFHKLFGIYKKNIPRFPSSLVLRFNYLRSLFHFGGEEQRGEAKTLAEQILAAEPSAWRVDVLEDVFTWDVFNTRFNYRAYIDAVMRHYTDEQDVQAELKRLISASVHHYLGALTGDIEHHRAAKELDPSFAFYGLAFAKSLLEDGSEPSRREAIALLRELADGSVVFDEAFELLETAAARGENVPRFEELAEVAQRIEDNTRRIAQLQPEIDEIFRHLDFDYAYRRRLEIEVEGYGPDTPMVSVVIAAHRSEVSVHPLLRRLADQTISSVMEVVLCDSNRDESAAVLDYLEGLGIGVKFVQVDLQTPTGGAFNRGIERSTAEFVTCITPEHKFRPHGLERLASVLMDNRLIALSYGDFMVTRGEEHSVDKDKGFMRRPEFSRRRLFRDLDVEPCCLWRRNLHERYGFFEEEWGEAATYAFWLKVGLEERFQHLSSIVGIWHFYDQQSIEQLGMRRGEGFARARRELWPSSWGEIPKPLDIEMIPSTLYDPLPFAEARWLADFQLVPNELSHLTVWLLSLARELILSADWSLAELALETCIDSNPSVVTPYLLLFEMHRHLGNLKAADEALERAGDLRTVDSLVLNRLSARRQKWGNTEGALAAAEKACSVRRPTAISFNNLANLLLEKGMIQKAQKVTTKMLDVYPLSIEGWRLQAIIAERNGDEHKSNQAQAKLRALERRPKKKGKE